MNKVLSTIVKILRGEFLKIFNPDGKFLSHLPRTPFRCQWHRTMPKLSLYTFGGLPNFSIRSLKRYIHRLCIRFTVKPQDSQVCLSNYFPRRMICKLYLYTRPPPHPFHQISPFTVQRFYLRLKLWTLCKVILRKSVIQYLQTAPFFHTYFSGLCLPDLFCLVPYLVPFYPPAF